MSRIRMLCATAACALTACLAAPAMAGEVRGSVSDATDVNALRAAEIRILELDRRTTTERDGQRNHSNPECIQDPCSRLANSRRQVQHAPERSPNDCPHRE